MGHVSPVRHVTVISLSRRRRFGFTLSIAMRGNGFAFDRPLTLGWHIRFSHAGLLPSSQAPPKIVGIQVKRVTERLESEQTITSFFKKPIFGFQKQLLFFLVPGKKIV